MLQEISNVLSTAVSFNLQFYCTLHWCCSAKPCSIYRKTLPPGSFNLNDVSLAVLGTPWVIQSGRITFPNKTPCTLLWSAATAIGNYKNQTKRDNKLLQYIDLTKTFHVAYWQIEVSNIWVWTSFADYDDVEI